MLETEEEYLANREKSQKKYRLIHDRKPYDQKYREAHRSALRERQRLRRIWLTT